MSIDSGGNYHGYIGDICRMAIQGEPDAELEDLLAEIESIQRAAMKPVRAGAMGREIYAAAEPLRVEVEAPQSPRIPRPRHGHGQPRGAAAHRPRAGALSGDRCRPCRWKPAWWCRWRPRCCIRAAASSSWRTPWSSPTRGHEIYGEGARGWNRAGTARRARLNARLSVACASDRCLRPLARAEGVRDFHRIVDAAFQSRQRSGRRARSRAARSRICASVGARRDAFARAHHRHDQRPRPAACRFRATGYRRACGRRRRKRATPACGPARSPCLPTVCVSACRHIPAACRRSRARARRSRRRD